jgi:uncharacterized membrane protein YczE
MDSVRFSLIENALLQRSLVFICGLFIMAIGVDLSVIASLGVSPISSTPYVYSLSFPLTLGQTTVILNILLVVLQILLLQKKYKWIQLVQVPAVILFGCLIDMTMPLVSWISPTHYTTQAFFCFLSCVVLALGIFILVKAKVTYLPGEGLAIALSQRFGFEFSKSKIGVDCSLVITGIISSLIFLESLQGIREGTIVAALLVGYLIRFYNRTIPFPRALLPQTQSGQIAETTPNQCEEPEGSRRLKALI